MENLRPSTLIALVILLALIFVPAFFIDVQDMRGNQIPDANGRDAPPAYAPPAPRDGQSNRPADPPPETPVPRSNNLID